MVSTPAPRPGRGGGTGTSQRPRTGGQAADLAEPATGPTTGTILIDIAASVALATEVQTAFRNLKKMKPNPAAVRTAASRWYDASQKYGESVGQLKSSWIQLGSYWEGKAFEKFKEYMTEIVVPTAEENASVLFDIGNALIDAHNKIVEEYDEGMRSYAETVSKAIDYHKDLNTLEGDAKKATWSALHDVINFWIMGMMTRKAKVQTIADLHAGAMTALRGKIQQLKAPVGAPDIVSDKGRWSYSG